MTLNNIDTIDDQLNMGTTNCKPKSKNKNKIFNKNNIRNCKLSCFYVNARSIRNKKNELLAQIETENPDIVGITETWLNDEIDYLNEFKLVGYNNFSKNRTHKRGGGIIIFIRDSIKMVQINMETNAVYDLLLTEIILNTNNKLLFGIIYRPPNQNEQTDQLMFQELETHVANKELILIGDFNYPTVNWETHTADHEGERIINYIEDNFYIQKVTQPTRGDNILDLVMCSDDDLISTVEVGDRFSTSDHNIIRFEINTKLCKNINEEMIPDYKKTNFQTLRNEMANVNWDSTMAKKI